MTPAKDAAELQARFDAFRRHFNEERPHEALDQTPPAEHWQPSRRPMPKHIEEPWYDADHEVLRVRSDGGIRWRGELMFISESLVREPVGVAEHESGHIVRFMHRDLGIIGHDGRFRPFAPPRARLRRTKCDTDAIEGSASPLNPSVTMPSRSSARRILLVAWRSTASTASSGSIPAPSSSTEPTTAGSSASSSGRTDPAQSLREEAAQCLEHPKQQAE